MKIDYPRLYVQFHPSYLEPPANSKQFLFSFGSFIVATGDKSEKNSLLQSKSFTLCHDFCSNLMFHFHSTLLELNLIKKYIAQIEKTANTVFPCFRSFVFDSQGLQHFSISLEGSSYRGSTVNFWPFVISNLLSLCLKFKTLRSQTLFLIQHIPCTLGLLPL